PPMARPSNFAGVTEAFASFLFVTAPLCNSRVPMPPAGMFSAAYDVPPSATNNASRAMALWRMYVRVLSTGRVSPYWVPGAPLAGPRLPFWPKAGWLWCDVLLLEAAAAVLVAG